MREDDRGGRGWKDADDWLWGFLIEHCGGGRERRDGAETTGMYEYYENQKENTS